eukprot:CAMPEP_0185846842 /NCGR_PEP_ID=MMETSP1354-20130828/2337_1 /TAXON_ID=708628 /ORGANISM="Erythrolobus madagascarensis, Strain CCMP3276" /LENGTH=435 /DNA_ID=CAMNT_0028547051 /DNA_START=92 /DNA_END=1399 /DNA_ORIENTATION=-
MPERELRNRVVRIASDKVDGKEGTVGEKDTSANGTTVRGSAACVVPLGDAGREKALEGFRKPYDIPDEFPEMSAVLGVIPKHCFEKPLTTSLSYMFASLFLTVSLPVLAWKTLPTPDVTSPVSVLCWLVYAFWEGTIATGCWVVAHECGHNAFCENKYIQDSIGFVLHSALLVPYFSWQRSHAVHHSRTNHLTEGETHVPETTCEGDSGIAKLRLFDWIGEDAFAVVNLFNHLVLGWPAYLLTGATGSPARGFSNHFVPSNDALFPGNWKAKVLASDVGIVAVLFALYEWSVVYGATQVVALYALPYLFVNMWLVLYTWLQHTDVDVPHFDARNWTWLKGAFMTIDRPYPQPFDWLHHKIGSTHVAHHICSRIPHYHAREATDAIKKAFPEYYLYDPTPIVPAMWRVAKTCVATTPEGDRHYYTNPTATPEPASE